MHLEWNLSIASASLTLISAPVSDGASSLTHSTKESFGTPEQNVAYQQSSDNSPLFEGSGKRGLAVCLCFKPSSSRCSGGSSDWSVRKSLHARADAPCIDVRHVSRRHGFDVSAGVGSLELFAGEISKVKNRQPHALLLSSVPSVVTGIVLHDSRIDDMDKVAGTERLMEELAIDCDQLLTSHVSIYEPGHEPAGRSSTCVSVQVGCLALNLDLDLAHQLIERVRCLRPDVPLLASASPAPMYNSSSSSSSALNLFATPQRLTSLSAPGGDELGDRGKQYDIASMLDGLQLQVRLGLAFASAGSRSVSGTGQAGGGGDHFRDWVRATCRGGLVVWNRVAVTEGEEFALVKVQQVACYAVSASDGAVTQVLARQDHAPAHAFSHGSSSPSSFVLSQASSATKELPPILSLKICERGGGPGKEYGVASWFDKTEHSAAERASVVSEYIVKVFSAICEEVESGTWFKTNVIRNFRQVHRCLTGHSLVSLLLACNFVADRLHAISIASQVVCVFVCVCVGGELHTCGLLFEYELWMA